MGHASRRSHCAAPHHSASDALQGISQQTGHVAQETGQGGTDVPVWGIATHRRILVAKTDFEQRQKQIRYSVRIYNGVMWGVKIWNEVS